MSTGTAWAIDASVGLVACRKQAPIYQGALLSPVVPSKRTSCVYTVCTKLVAAFSYLGIFYYIACICAADMVLRWKVFESPATSVKPTFYS